MLKSIQYSIERIIQKLESINKDDTKISTNKILTGFHELDKKLNGFNKKQLIIIAGHPGIGKTSFILSCISNLLKRSEINTALYSPSQSIDQITKRLLSIRSGVPYGRLLAGKLDKFEVQIIKQAAKQLEVNHLMVDDSIVEKTDEFIGAIENSTFSPDIIFIDSLQYAIPKNGDTKSYNFLICKLSNLAVQLNLPIVAIADLDGVSADSDFTQQWISLSYFRNKRTFEEQAAKLISIYRPEYYKIDRDENNKQTHGKADLHILKNEDGFESAVELKYEGKTGAYSV
ncbi:MAG: DnaB-like helicase C-terminal domain-containing protein [Bacteroidota bacterium]|nr:DnaB-like helicase C-terminal domain-containing protein [Bacteroidota bacterium]